jgi:hypothetical protein
MGVADVGVPGPVTPRRSLALESSLEGLVEDASALGLPDLLHDQPPRLVQRGQPQHKSFDAFRSEQYHIGMSPKAQFGVMLVGVFGLATLFLLQQQKIKHLVAENADLRSQLEQLGSLKDANEHLAEQLKAAAGTLQSNQSELLRLRGQASRLRQLEQDNTQLKAQRQQLEKQMHQAQLAAVSSQPGEVTAVSEVIKVGSEISNASITDLGVLELSDGTPTRFDLGGGTNCVVTPTALSDGNVLMQISSGATKADGTVSELGVSRLTARPGQHCSISVGDRMIGLAVTLKPQ